MSENCKVVDGFRLEKDVKEWFLPYEMGGGQWVRVGQLQNGKLLVQFRWPEGGCDLVALNLVTALEFHMVDPEESVFYEQKHKYRVSSGLIKMGPPSDYAIERHFMPWVLKVDGGVVGTVILVREERGNAERWHGILTTRTSSKAMHGNTLMELGKKLGLHDREVTVLEGHDAQPLYTAYRSSNFGFKLIHQKDGRWCQATPFTILEVAWGAEELAEMKRSFGIGLYFPEV